MRIRCAIKSLPLLLVLAVLASRCGIEEIPHYGADKTYGLLPTEPEEAGPSFDPSGMGDEIAAESVDETIPPDTLIFKGYFQAIMDHDSVQIIQDGYAGGFRPSESVPFFESLVSTSKTTDVVGEQTYGDGVNSKFVQYVDSAMEGSGLSNYIDNLNDSGSQTSYRVNGPNCDGPVFCTNRQVVVHRDGKAVTTCFYDAKTGAIAAVPNGISPNFSAADIQPYFAVKYPHFTVRRYAGETECQNPVGDILSQGVISVSVMADQVQPERFIQKPNLLPADYAVKIVVNKVVKGKVINARLDNTKPYVDQLAGMQARTVYYINESNRQFVKMIKTIRKPIKPYLINKNTTWYDPRDWWGINQAGKYILNLKSVKSLIQYDGVKMDYHVEFCQNFLKPNSEYYCK